MLLSESSHGEPSGGLMACIAAHHFKWEYIKYAKYFGGGGRGINIYLHFMSFLHIDMTRVVEILHLVRQKPAYIVIIMGADVLVTQGARVSATMIFTVFNRINSVRVS